MTALLRKTSILYATHYMVVCSFTRHKRKEKVNMGILAWIVFGLIAGVIAKFIMPGRDGGGFILTCVLGIVGAVVGGWLATMFGYGGDITGFDMHSFIVAVIGAIVVLAVFRLVRR
jgi:uncharacterized membrane protein YeaQ/YmgE (transglycosylase-associated protein family)